jgi:hypothetical protein
MDYVPRIVVVEYIHHLQQATATSAPPHKPSSIGLIPWVGRPRALDDGFRFVQGNSMSRDVLDVPVVLTKVHGRIALFII